MTTTPQPAADADLLRQLQAARSTALRRARKALRSPRAMLGARRLMREVQRRDRAAAGEQRLQALLFHASRLVPWYSDVFQIRASDEETPAPPLDEFPILRKSDLQDSFANLIAREPFEGVIGADTFLIGRTSGSTGATTSHLKTESQDYFAYRVMFLRALAIANAPRFGEMYDLGLHPIMPAMIGTLEMPPYAFATYNFLHFSVASDDERVADARTLIRVGQPDVVFGLPSRLLELVRLGELEGVETRPRAVLSTYEQLTESTRSALERGFSCRVTNVYGTSELGMCGCECEAGSLHFPADLVVAEVVREDGTAVDPGEAGDLVVTSLSSWVMPLIRYAPGDRAIAGSGSCECGSGDPFVAAFAGRETQYYLMRDGTRRTPYALMSLIDNLNLPEYQIVQERPGAIRLVVPRGTVIDGASLDRVRERATAYCGGDRVDIAVDTTGEFILSPSGKRNPMVQLVPSSGRDEHGAPVETSPN